MKRGNLIIVGLIAAGFATVAAPSDASALDLRIGAQLKGGGALLLPDDGVDATEDESHFGYGYGAQLNAGIGVIPQLYLGVYGQFQQSVYTLESEFMGETSETDVTLSHPSAGLHLRYDLGLAVAQLQGGYVFGSSEIADVDTSTDLSGYQVGAFVGFSMPLVPGVADLDIGPYVDYASLSPDAEGAEDAPSDGNLSFGLAIQANFGLPL